MRRPSRPPRRLRASHDEHVPSLAVLQQWNSASQLPICVVEVAGKGLGVAARRGLPAGVVVAEYRFRIVKRAACSPGDYRVEVAGVARGLVGKIDARTFGPPSNGVAQVGALLNEPSVGMVPNCVRRAGWVDPPGGKHRRGSFSLVTSRPVRVGEELTWDYGKTYGRREYEHHSPNQQASAAYDKDKAARLSAAAVAQAQKHAARFA